MAGTGAGFAALAPAVAAPGAAAPEACCAAFRCMFCAQPPSNGTAVDAAATIRARRPAGRAVKAIVMLGALHSRPQSCVNRPADTGVRQAAALSWHGVPVLQWLKLEWLKLQQHGERHAAG